jgi:DnaK suppressor protein
MRLGSPWRQASSRCPSATLGFTECSPENQARASDYNRPVLAVPNPRRWAIAIHPWQQREHHQIPGGTVVKATKAETSQAKTPASKATPARATKAAATTAARHAPPAAARKSVAKAAAPVARHAPAPKLAASASRSVGQKPGKLTRKLEAKPPTAVASKPLAKTKTTNSTNSTNSKHTKSAPQAAIKAAAKMPVKAPPRPPAHAPAAALPKARKAADARGQPATNQTPAPVAPVRATLPPAQVRIHATSLATTVASRPQVAAHHSAPKSMSSIAPTHAPPKADPKLVNAWKTKSPKDLTDAEVLAMPESEYMKSSQLEFFRHRLSTLRADLLRSASETTEHLREDTLLVPDPADRATIEEEHSLELRARDRERKLLKKVEQVIVLIDAGEYGWCEETGEPIGIGRLLARPTATLSLEAQQRREMKQKMFGD